MQHKLPSSGGVDNRWRFTKRFASAGVLVGLVAGAVEGLILFSFQHPEVFHLHVVGPAILLVAPLVDAMAFGSLGGILGVLADLTSRTRPRVTSGLAALGTFLAAVYAVFVPARAWFETSFHNKYTIAGIALMGGFIVTLTARMAWRYFQRQPVSVAALFWPRSRILLGVFVLLSGVILVGWRVFRTTATRPDSNQAEHLNSATGKLPNLVMISLDTARADHFSGYGYPLPTTPHFDKLAQQGVLFETAVAPASWTLPTFATVFTGLLPHQHSADEHTPLAGGFSTLASILRARGYETAGFNANFTMGTARTGLAHGFDLYNDDDASLAADLASIGSVKIFWWLFYYPFLQPDSLVRRDAGELNRPVSRWFRNRSQRPFFLFVNYFDVHEPYHSVPGIGNQFGDANKTLAQRIRAEMSDSQMQIDAPQSPAERAEIIAGYDSTLAWADRQAGDLLQLIRSSPEWPNTYVVIFSDHGQAFGEHGYYGHHLGLNWELLHVPLIIIGPGVPAGQRIASPVALQRLFQTALDLTGGGAPSQGDSLSCYWRLPAGACDSSPPVLSEFAVEANDLDDDASISLVTPGWQFIHDSAGNRELYNLAADPREQVNLAASPENQARVEALQQALFARLRATSRPWIGESYLWGLGESDFALLTGQPPGRLSRWSERKTQRPSGPNDELLHSLPYQ